MTPTLFSSSFTLCNSHHRHWTSLLREDAFGRSTAYYSSPTPITTLVTDEISSVTNTDGTKNRLQSCFLMRVKLKLFKKMIQNYNCDSSFVVLRRIGFCLRMNMEENSEKSTLFTLGVPCELSNFVFAQLAALATFTYILSCSCWHVNVRPRIQRFFPRCRKTVS